MSVNENADQDVASNSVTEDTPPEDTPINEQTLNENWEIEGVESPLTSLQFHYLSLLQRLVALKDEYQTDPSYEKWKMNAINQSIYSTLRDCIEENIGDSAKNLLHREHHVN